MPRLTWLQLDIKIDQLKVQMASGKMAARECMEHIKFLTGLKQVSRGPVLKWAQASE